jgi:uncharacterized protein YkwD
MSRLSLILTLLLTLGPAQAMACRQPDDAARMAEATLAAINAERDQRGMATLTPDPRLISAALAHACDSAARNRMSHRGSDGSDLGDRVKREGYRYRAIAENVAAGYRTPASVVQGWMDSSGHRRNILTRNARDVGLGIATASDGTLHWVLNLGTDR